MNARPDDDIADGAFPLDDDPFLPATVEGDEETSGGLFAYPGVVITDNAMELPNGLPFSEWERIGKTLKTLEGAVMWWIGDWLAFGATEYGEKYAQAVEAHQVTGTPVETIRKAVWVAEKFSVGSRLPTLSWSHHQAAASLDESARYEFLRVAASENWSRQETRQRANRIKAAGGSLPSPETCTVACLSTLRYSGTRFQTVYADPPWLYGNQATRAATGNHYGGMTVEEIAELPVREFVADNAHLHMWTTNGFLFEAKAIMEAWGFEYKSCFVWVKPQMGIGNYWRVSHEFLLFGLRGKLPFQDHGQMSWRALDRTEHSAKPRAVRDIIEKVSPGPRIELFGREVSPGWAVWGNQINKNLFTHGVGELAAK